VTTKDYYPSRTGDRPRVLPRLDPVVYAAWSPGAPLSRAQTEAYERDGFLVLEDVFDPKEVEALQAEARRLKTGETGRIEDATIITEPGSDARRSIFKIHDQSDVFGRLAADNRLLDVARFLLDDDIYLHQTRLNYKPGFKGKEFYWHSDFETWHVEDGMPRMRALSMSIQLTDNTPLNGPLMLMPGSHKSYIACVGETPEEHFKQSLKKQEYGVPDETSLSELAATCGIEAPTGPAGSVLLFDCNAMHGSNSNITPWPRTNAFFVFNAMSNALVAPFGPEIPRPEFIAARSALKAVEPATSRLILQTA
jgi:ectoine hydroxylase